MEVEKEEDAPQEAQEALHAPARQVNVPDFIYVPPF